MGSLDKYFGTVDNPAYDPDGEETFTANGAGGIALQETPVFKEEKVDKNSLPHQIKFIRRRTSSRACIITVIALLLVLIGIAIAVYFVVRANELNSPVRDTRDVWEVEGRFKLMNRTYKESYDDPTTEEYRIFVTHVEDTIFGVFPRDGSSVRVSHVVVTDIRRGSVEVVYHVVFVEPYNVTYAETQVEEMFFLAARALDNRILLQLGDLVIDRRSISFTALVDVTSTTRFMSTTGETLPSTVPTTQAPPECEPITIPLCLNNSAQVANSLTVFPNHLLHVSQVDAERDTWLYERVVDSGCHPYVQRFVCGMLTPACMEDEQERKVATPLCRELCEEVMLKCSSFSTRFNSLNCSEFPDHTASDQCITAPGIERVSLRLSGGLGPNEGHVEVYSDGEWGAVCDTMWNDHAAEVVCRQLNIPGRAKALEGSHFGPSDKLIAVHDVKCRGREAHFALCDMDAGPGVFCDQERIAGVICDADNRDVSLPVQLAGGPSSTSGRLEVYYNNTWGTVCGSMFGVDEATVVCAMLGQPFLGMVQDQSEVSIPESSGPIWLSSVACTGAESSLVHCAHEGWGGHTYCSHDEDVYVQCGETIDPLGSAPMLELRLVDGPSDYEGRVEIRYHNEWGTVCRGLFDDYNAAVFCRSLGYSAQGASGQRSRYGQGEGRVWLNSLYCTGSEQSVTECRHDGWGQNPCSHFEDLSISCPPPTNATTAPPPKYLARLVDSSDPTRGRLELYQDGEWGTVCNHNFDDVDATIACHMMGFTGEGRFLDYEYGAGDSSQTITMDQVECTGEETSLFDCIYWPKEELTCTHRLDVSIECNVTAGSTSEYPLRLTGGPNSLQGFLQVQYNGQWGAVCKHGFSDTEAVVACQTLGYRDVGKVLSWGSSFFRDLWLSDVTCTGGEASLFDCAHTWGDQGCDDKWEDSVYITCDNVAVRLVGGATEREGRVEVQMDNTWGTVCADFMTNSETATVICRSLGYNVTMDSVEVLEDGSIPASEGYPIMMSDLDCSGTESEIIHCEHEGRTKSEAFCEHSEDLTIRCTVPSDV